MSSVPYLHFYVADYLGDTQHLSTEQHGAYLLLLMAMWRSGGELANDDNMLARICRLSLKKWRAIKPVVAALLVEQDGKLSQKRLLSELRKAEEKTNRRRAAGRAGGTAKALNSRVDGSSNARLLPKQSESELELASEPESKPLADRLPSSQAVSRAKRGPTSEKDGKTAKKTPLPEDFPHQAARAAAVKFWTDRQRLDLAGRVGDIAEHFRNFYTANGGRLIDWPAGWRAWVKKEMELVRAPNGNGHGPTIEQTSDEGWLSRLEVFCGIRGQRPGAWTAKWGPKPNEPAQVVPARAYEAFMGRHGYDPREGKHGTNPATAH